MGEEWLYYVIQSCRCKERFQNISRSKGQHQVYKQLQSFNFKLFCNTTLVQLLGTDGIVASKYKVPHSFTSFSKEVLQPGVKMSQARVNRDHFLLISITPSLLVEWWAHNRHLVLVALYGYYFYFKFAFVKRDNDTNLNRMFSEQDKLIHRDTVSNEKCLMDLLNQGVNSITLYKMRNW